MKCITFRRWYPGANRDVSSWTYPIETDAHKLSLANLIFAEVHGVMKEFICELARLEETCISIACENGQGYYLKQGLQFCLLDDPTDFDDVQTLTFLCSLDAEKIAFANWVIEHKLGDFRDENTAIFITELYVPAVGQTVMVPVAEPAPTEPAE